ncbi:PSD1 and planctomycete cytochrome C domain-containing protein [Botrimarina hoheduenensis]|uniref:Planctomycete cytochrome C n=1 Tax=Botrimarina hoheduenensis TaxID=2528000 RepID=A0A5C5VZD4_9BACT|nr:PSD1 and planctomycete cytochrome C domain-containing protein [Botrimarina hoheduenensis]TWT43333.1 Planctomycete cytochrome C [Botrimarina hoheduenensis]
MPSRALFSSLSIARQRLPLVVCLLIAQPVWAVDFNASVRPIFVKSCLACHGGVRQQGSLSFITREQALATTDSGDPSILPGNAAESVLMERIKEPDDDLRMPPAEHGPRLTPEEVETLRAWIDAGAPWSDPWSFQVPVDPLGPATADSDRQFIDRMIDTQAASAGLTPGGPAPAEEWLRRVSFDLVGLPPTAAHRASITAGLTPPLREQIVDELLASPHFGERWAAVWLDLARYADTIGYERDPHRDAWPYRDAVIRAFNRDQPLDEFLVRQLAGDRLPEPTMEDLLATTFHRNAPTNIEGGTDDEEFRIIAVVDRVDTTGQALLGLTVGCARCHDHPYDPITQADYYRLFDLFNSTADVDLREEWPTVQAPLDPSRYEEAQRLDRERSATLERLFQRISPLASELQQWRGVTFDHAESTGETTLEVRAVDPIESAALALPPAGGNEIVAVGTLTDRSIYAATAAATPLTVTALRLEALPLDPATAAILPQMGFVLSKLELTIERSPAAEGEPPVEEQVFFVAGFADEADPFIAADESLEDNPGGWSVYTKQRQPRWAVFVLDRAVTLAAGDRLRFRFKHDKATDGQDALLIRRLRAAFSSDTRWTELIRDEAFAADRLQEHELRQQRKAIASVSTPIMAELPERLRRPTRLMERGNWLSPGAPLEADVPAALRHDDQPVRDRLMLARWLTSPEQPLTARVFVNRVWRELMGTGIVATVDDFGSTGETPTHPQVLDHLAVRFSSTWKWSLKQLLRELTLTRAYGRDARATPATLALDPSNRWLARGPRTRLTAEMVRDQALVLSGRFNPKAFGPPVMPYQPEGVWNSVHSTARWQAADDEARFRRAIYVYWKRTAGYPSLMAFDMPSREQCAAKRDRTNTPLQALVTMNDPAYVELAEGFATRMLEHDASLEERVAWGYTQTTSTVPTTAALRELLSLHSAALVAADARDPRPESDPPERFAMTIVASTLLNLDAALTK